MLNQSSSRHVLAHFCGYAALQVRGRLDTPPAVHCLPSPSARRSFQPGLRHPGPFVQPRSKLHKRLGCICVLPVKPFPLEGWEPWVQVQLLRLAWSSPQRRHSRIHRACTKAGHGLPWHIRTCPPPHRYRGSLPHVRSTRCKPALLRGLLPSQQHRFLRKDGSPATRSSSQRGS